MHLNRYPGWFQIRALASDSLPENGALLCTNSLQFDRAQNVHYKKMDGYIVDVEKSLVEAKINNNFSNPNSANFVKLIENIKNRINKFS